MHILSSGESLPVRCWSDCLYPANGRPARDANLIGVLTGEGVGPEVIGAALRVLSAAQAVTGDHFQIEFGPVIGRESERRGGKALPDDVVDFCRRVFVRGGAILNGPGGGRYVYDLRHAFDLYCKLSPIRVANELLGAIRLKAEHARGVDILMVRENAAGLYQGAWTTGEREGARIAAHSFSYTQAQVERILWPAARLAKMRRGHLTVVFKESGVPAISELWRDCALAIAEETAVRCSLLDIDHVAYRLVQHPREFDVIVAPNLFGDVLSDLGGVLLGSRGLCFAASYSDEGAAVYQTNHGAAYDLAGTNCANPVAQILSLAMLLRESFGLCDAATLIERAVAQAWRAGWRTADIAEPEFRVIGTREMSERIAHAVNEIAQFHGTNTAPEPAVVAASA
jgi:3-isopropylmalate dehydrogenase